MEVGYFSCLILQLGDLDYGLHYKMLYEPTQNPFDSISKTTLGNFDMSMYVVNLIGVGTLSLSMVAIVLIRVIFPVFNDLINGTG